jgi:hypothetical protein
MAETKLTKEIAPPSKRSIQLDRQLTTIEEDSASPRSRMPPAASARRRAGGRGNGDVRTREGSLIENNVRDLLHKTSRPRIDDGFTASATSAEAHRRRG